MRRILNDKARIAIKKNLKRIGVGNVSLHFEYGSEANEFSKKIIDFLIEEGFNVYPPVSRTQTGITRGNYLEIKKHPSDFDCAIITIGSMF